MGATSVQGTGPGSAAIPGGGMKGSTNTSMAVHMLVGPRVVMAGNLTLNSSGFGTVYYPVLPSTVSKYSISLSTNKNTLPYWGGFTTSQFSVTGGANATVGWAVNLVGIWGSSAAPEGLTG